MNKTGMIIMLVICCILMSSMSKAADSTVSGAISVRSAKSQFIYGEPVVIHVAISNDLPDPITIYTELQNGVGATYEMSFDNNVFTNIASGLHHDPVGRTYILNPNTVFLHDEILCFDWRQKQELFHVGTNYIRVHYYGKISASVPVVVVKSDNQADIESGNIMTKPEVMNAIALKNVSKIHNELSTVVEKGGILSPYAAYFLATYGGSDKPEENERMANFADTNAFILRAQVVLLKGETAFKKGEFVKAWTEFEKIRQNYKSTAAYCALENNNRYAMSRQDAEQKELKKPKIKNEVGK